MRKEFLEYTGVISSISVLDKECHFIIANENREDRRMFGIWGGSKRGAELDRESDIERHLRYDLGMDTNIVFTVDMSWQTILSWRWKVMRTLEEAARYIVDRARLEEYKDGTQTAMVNIEYYVKPYINFPLTDTMIDEIESLVRNNPFVTSLDRNGWYFSVTADFFKTM